MKHHAIKTLPEYFQAVIDGVKTFEARYNDRGYAVGHTLALLEYSPTDGFTGRVAKFVITYTLTGEGFGIRTGFVVMGIKPILNEAPH